MEEDDAIAQFTAITSATPNRAQQYLTLSDGNLEQAIQLFFESGGVDMGGSFGAGQQPAPTASRGSGQGPDAPIQVDSADEDEEAIPTAITQTAPSGSDEGLARELQEDDEAMARRLQEEAYGSGSASGMGGAGVDVDPDTGVRRPMARTQETLAGPSSRFAFEDEDDLQEAVREQILSRRREHQQRAGIFNQRPPASSSVWDDEEQRRQDLSRATGGASDATSKSSRLAEMFRPPFDLMSNVVSWDGLRAAGKENEKWILLNIQDPNVFDCQVLNRDIWKHDEIRQTVKENFIFKQYTKTDTQASKYIQYYFKDHENQAAYPHIAIVDPRTGEQVKVWSGPPAPKAADFLMQLHEFLDRYSLSANSRNPVATRKAKEAAKDVHKMTEDEMLEMAMQNSLQAGKPASNTADPDLLTHQADAASKANGGNDSSQVAKTESPLDAISSSNPHTEPPPDAMNTTRIQFRYPGGRVIRKFQLDDPVRRIYEWLKASPLEASEGRSFELVFMGKNLIDSTSLSIEQAGLKNGSIMVEFVDT